MVSNPVMQSRSRLSVIVFILLFFGGHPQFNYHGCPDLNLRQISQSESEAQGIYFGRHKPKWERSFKWKYAQRVCSCLNSGRFSLSKAFVRSIYFDHLKIYHFLCSSDWYIAIVCCHAFGVVAGFIGLMVTLLTVCLSDDTSTKTFFAVILGIISCKLTLFCQFFVQDGFYLRGQFH